MKYVLLFIQLWALRVNLSAQEAMYKIPVVVHVVHNGEEVGSGPNISYEQIASQIEVLNEDFRRTKGTNGFNEHPLGTDTQIEFFLTPTDPEGKLLEEPGVDRVDGGRASWPKGNVRNPIDRVLKPISIWDPGRFFNIWTVNFGGFVSRDLLGYAQFPEGSGLSGLPESGEDPTTDGIVVGYKYFGSSEKGSFPVLFAPFNLGRTTTHEVGHWLGLRHIWGDGACGVDDFCMDTPVSENPSFGCPAQKSTCGTADLFENYMDYTDDPCMNMFTRCQKERMLTVLTSSPRRKELFTKENINPPTSTLNSLMEGIKLWPNPSSTGNFWLHIPLSLRVSSLDIYDLLGKRQLVEVDSKSYTDNKCVISLAKNKVGLYIVKLNFVDGRHYSTRILIQP
ncbi:MAG: M43 family zinc metalloprotease [Bacteroidota bacterium]